jgi:putative ATP-grasp target RiPP
MILERPCPATRPFSLRHVVAGARLDTPPAWRYTYCHERQIALVYDEDGSLIPLLRHTRPGPTPSPGTSATPDGQPGNPPPEEMLPPDHQND